MEIFFNSQQYYGEILIKNNILIYKGDIPVFTDKVFIEIYDGNILYDFQAMVDYRGSSTILNPIGQVNSYTKNAIGEWRAPRYFLEGNV